MRAENQCPSRIGLRVTAPGQSCDLWPVCGCSQALRGDLNAMGLELCSCGAVPFSAKVEFARRRNLAGSQLAQVRPRRCHSFGTILKKPPHVLDAHPTKFLPANVAQMKLAHSSQINREVESGNSNAGRLDGQTIAPRAPDVCAAFIELARQN